MDIRAYDKLISMTEQERDSLFQTKLMIVHEEKAKLKMDRVYEVRNLKNTGYSNREISRRTGLHTSTIKKYLDENFNPVHSSYGKKKEGILSPYIKEVDAMLAKGLMGSVIEEKIRESGYEGSSSTLRHYITDWKRRRKFYYDKSQEKEIKTETVVRKDVFKLLFNPIEKVKTISQELFEIICRENPYFNKVHDIIWKFKKLLKDRDVCGLNEWIDRAQNLEIREICSFVNGLKRDFISNVKTQLSMIITTDWQKAA